MVRVLSRVLVPVTCVQPHMLPIIALTDRHPQSGQAQLQLHCGHSAAGLIHPMHGNCGPSKRYI